MDNSIENIWREGFLDEEALVAPKLNDLYNQKSINTVERLMKRGRNNMFILGVAAVICLAGFIQVGNPIAGILLALQLGYLLWFSYKRAQDVDMLDKSQSSYTYLKAVQKWLKRLLASYKRIYRFLYPSFFLTITLGLTLSNPGKRIIEMVLEKHPNLILWWGIPVFWLAELLLIAIIIGAFAGPILKIDVNLIYGKLIDKIDDMIVDMEELRM